MSYFTHAENQRILWNLVHKSPHFIPTGQPEQQEQWFRQMMNTFYMKNMPTIGAAKTSGELLVWNKRALDYLVHDLQCRKTILAGQSTILPSIQATNITTVPMASMAPTVTMAHTVNTVTTVPTAYSMTDERNQRADLEKSRFAEYQSQYMSLLAKPNIVPPMEFTVTTNEEKITNMDDLIASQIRMRETELRQIHAKREQEYPQLSKQSDNNSPLDTIRDSPPRIRFIEDTSPPSLNDTSDTDKRVSWSSVITEIAN